MTDKKGPVLLYRPGRRFGHRNNFCQLYRLSYSLTALTQGTQLRTLNGNQTVIESRSAALLRGTLTRGSLENTHRAPHEPPPQGPLEG